MNIDLLPFSAFALESSAGPARHVGEAHTLTLRLELVPVHPAFEPAMSGTLSLDDATDEPAGLLRAAVVPAAGRALTITF